MRSAHTPAAMLSELREQHAAGRPIKFLYFWGHQPNPTRVTSCCLSQWFEAPFADGADRYLTAEHYMMARKAELFQDLAIRDQILSATTPGKAKALGRHVAGFDDTRWEQHRFAIVVQGNLLKFRQNPALQTYLMETGNKVLVEASPVDAIWGIGLSQDDPRAADPDQWPGLNLLGFALMTVRDQLRSAA